MQTKNASARFACPKCGKSVKAPAKFLGRRVKCPKCDQPFLLDPSDEIVDAELVASPPADTNVMARIAPSQLQVKNESLILYATLAIAAFLFVVISLSTAFIFLILAAIIYFGVLSHENKLESTAMRVSPANNPRLDELFKTASLRLGVPAPKLFTIQDNELNAYAIGFHSPGTVVLHSALLEKMTKDELMFIIGHELTHLKCGHCKFLVFTDATIGSAVNQLAATILDLIFLNWSRKAEFTCDRGGVIACKNPQAAMTALAKLECSDMKTVAEEVEKAKQGRQQLNNVLSTHPEIKNRILAIWDYCQTEDFRYFSSLAR